MKKKRKLDFKTLLEIVQQYETRGQFREGDGSAYKKALEHPESDYIFSHLKSDRQKWDHDRVRAEASKYTERYAFQKGSGGAYRYAFRNGMLDDLFPDSVKEPVSWCHASVKAEASKYQHRTDFKLNSSGAHKYAYQHRMLDELFGETYNTPSCDNDVVYLWKVKGCPVYKIGVTSKRLGDRRIRYVCRKGNLECEESHLVEVKDAALVEKALLSYGRPFEFGKPFSGSTEFRNLTDQEYRECLRLLYSKKV